jgi:hypothetical protein
VEFSSVTNASEGVEALAWWEAWNASGVVGNVSELVPPVIQALPSGVTTTPEHPESPRNVEYTSAEPVGFNFVTNPPPPVGLGDTVWKAPGVVGKLAELVPPTA